MNVFSDWEVYEALVSAFRCAVDDALWGKDDEDDEHQYLVTVKADYSELYVLVDPTGEEEREFRSKYSGDDWYTESSDDYDYIVDVWLQFGFDLR